MGAVLPYPTARKRPYNDGHRRYHDELPDGVVRLPRRSPEPIRMTTRASALLLAAILTEVDRGIRLRVASQVERMLDETPEDADLRAADQLLTAAILTAPYERAKP